MIDTSPEGLAEIRRNFGFWGEDDEPVILALIDALEAARAKIDEMDALLTDAYHGEAKARTEAEQWKLVMIGIVDELEEARAELRTQLKAAQAEIASLQSKIAYGPFKEMLPCP